MARRLRGRCQNLGRGQGVRQLRDIEGDDIGRFRRFAQRLRAAIGVSPEGRARGVRPQACGAAADRDH